MSILDGPETIEAMDDFLLNGETPSVFYWEHTRANGDYLLFVQWANGAITFIRVSNSGVLIDDIIVGSEYRNFEMTKP